VLDEIHNLPRNVVGGTEQMLSLFLKTAVLEFDILSPFHGQRRNFCLDPQITLKEYF
jgi:hypothetical protein